ncbi:PLP-dependent aminotransferase family protein [Ruania halotolerans]|uniref:MocR-like transcription factor YczR n=1 Tax=Ruania halotolerans TaxID=2897773 RepID=UPI001E43E15F|nr:PLP-dependent aminotransferase family protein [Ruania halotolerans]UFU06577.1 PLP-dependent aminotransferase family protein [Ruania halotolerans]
MKQSISARRVADLVGTLDHRPAYADLADRLRLLIGDGRIGYDVRLPGERELTTALGVSRTTVARAYAQLRDNQFAAARQGSGTYTRLPGGRAVARDRAIMPGMADADVIDLTCAASGAPPELASVFAEAAAELPAYLGSTGYYPHGLPLLQEEIAQHYRDRGLPTAPDQIMVTAGALAAVAITATALGGRGRRTLVETPTYPNAVRALRHAGGRLITTPVDPGGWILEDVGEVLRRTRPTLAYLVPDFQNPTGLLMSESEREVYAAHLRRAGTVAIVDEAHAGLALDPLTMPAPFAAFAPTAITVGSASKSHWGGLRVGWIRTPDSRYGGKKVLEQLTDARVGLDLGTAAMEQLVMTKLFGRPEIIEGHLTRVREQRDALAAEIGARLPSWRFRLPNGGLSLWCELPEALSTAVCAEAERHGVYLVPGPVFAAEGGLDRFLRIPWTRPAAELVDAVERLVLAWEQVSTAARPGRPITSRVVVA